MVMAGENEAPRAEPRSLLLPQVSAPTACSLHRCSKPPRVLTNPSILETRVLLTRAGLLYLTAISTHPEQGQAGCTCPSHHLHPGDLFKIFPQTGTEARLSSS